MTSDANRLEIETCEALSSIISQSSSVQLSPCSDNKKDLEFTSNFSSSNSSQILNILPNCKITNDQNNLFLHNNIQNDITNEAITSQDKIRQKHFIGG